MEARKAIFYARYEVSAVGGEFLSTGHLLLGLVRVSPHLFENPDSLRVDLESLLANPAKPDTAGDVPLSDEATRALQLAVGLAKDSTVEPEHILEAIRRTDPGLPVWHRPSPLDQ
jgi:hypothetical protein